LAPTSWIFFVNKLSIYLWDPNVSPHKLAFFNRLSAAPEIRQATYIAQEEWPRVEQGWSPGAFDRERVIVNPGPQDVRRMVESSPRDSIHIFSGIHWVPCIVQGLRAVLANHRRFGLMSEPRVLEDWKGPFRLAHSWMTETAVRQYAQFILAIGANGPRWFQAAGYRSERIFPFAYFLPPPTNDSRRSPRDDDRIAVTYLGRIERSKGIFIFLDAVGRVKAAIRVEIAGAGSEATAVFHAASTASAPFEYRGAIPMSEVPDLLARTDILVAPSTTTDDGWGAVVSEALMAGVAVVASKFVGASVCLADPVRGVVVSDPNGHTVARAIDSLIDSGVLSNAHRKRRAEWAVACLSAAAGARHFLAILAHVIEGAPRPQPFYATDECEQR
jgi:glycosyltransferase involved in cell wall biosynthesis